MGVRLSNPLKVNTQNTSEAAQKVANQALELRDHQANNPGVGTTVRQLEGRAVSAYLHAWTEWHDSASILVQSLVESSEKLMRAAIAYDEQDHASGCNINSAGSTI